MARFIFKDFKVNKEKLEQLDSSIVKTKEMKELKKLSKMDRLDRTGREEDRYNELLQKAYGTKVSFFNEDIYVLSSTIYINLKGKLCIGDYDNSYKLSHKKGITGTIDIDTSDFSVEEYANLLMKIGESGYFSFDEAIEDAYYLENDLPMSELGQHWEWNNGERKELEFVL